MKNYLEKGQMYLSEHVKFPVYLSKVANMANNLINQEFSLTNI